jgi:hypothetical protein
MHKSAIDHLVVTAGSRETGSAYVSSVLGVPLVEGGAHARMGTHNALVRLGNASYLEVIAPNPNAPVPERPRWFELDGVNAVTRPRLATWVVRTNDIRTAVTPFPLSLGTVEIMARDSLKWLITVPADGSLPLDGAAPSLIQWLTEPHPAAALPDVGCSLVGLEIRHAQAEAIRTLIRAIGLDGPLVLAEPSTGRRPGLIAQIRTPEGIRVLGEP